MNINSIQGPISLTNSMLSLLPLVGKFIEKSSRPPGNDDAIIFHGNDGTTTEVNEIILILARQASVAFAQLSEQIQDNHYELKNGFIRENLPDDASLGPELYEWSRNKFSRPFSERLNEIDAAFDELESIFDNNFWVPHNVDDPDHGAQSHIGIDDYYGQLYDYMKEIWETWHQIHDVVTDMQEFLNEVIEKAHNLDSQAERAYHAAEAADQELWELIELDQMKR